MSREMNVQRQGNGGLFTLATREPLTTQPCM